MNDGRGVDFPIPFNPAVGSTETLRAVLMLAEEGIFLSVLSSGAEDLCMTGGTGVALEVEEGAVVSGLGGAPDFAGATGTAAVSGLGGAPGFEGATGTDVRTGRATGILGACVEEGLVNPEVAGGSLCMDCVCPVFNSSLVMFAAATAVALDTFAASAVDDDAFEAVVYCTLYKCLDMEVSAPDLAADATVLNDGMGIAFDDEDLSIGELATLLTVRLGEADDFFELYASGILPSTGSDSSSIVFGGDDNFDSDDL